MKIVVTKPFRSISRCLVIFTLISIDNNHLLDRVRPGQGREKTQQSEDRAIRTAQALADKRVGVIAWSREANPDIGEYGTPTTLFVSGDVPDME